jgi:cell division protease FtsH
MNDKIGNVSFYDSKQSEYTFNKPYSEATAQTIDDEVRRIISQAYERTKALLKSKRNELEIIAQKLLEKEIIFQSDLEDLIGKRPFEKETTYQAYTNRKVSGDGAVDLNTQALKHHEEEAKKEAEEKKAHSNGEPKTKEGELKKDGTR